MSTILKETTAAAITNAVSTTLKGDRAKTNAVDKMVADGIRSTDMISPKGKDSKSTASDELFASINKAIVLGFNTRVQALVNAPSAKGMTDAQKLTRRTGQMQIGAKRNDFKTALAKREAVAAGTTSRTRTLEEWCRDMANDGIKKCRNAEEAPFEIEAMIKALNGVLNIAKR